MAANLPGRQKWLHHAKKSRQKGHLAIKGTMASFVMSTGRKDKPGIISNRYRFFVYLPKHTGFLQKS